MTPPLGIQRVTLVAGALATAVAAVVFVRTRPVRSGASARGTAWASGGAPDRAVTGRRLTYLPGVDGLRAVAVLAVLLYHADLPWIRGGFLGVDVFFVISGYLITSLLLAEWRQRGRIDLPAFWLRRARRLLPALFLLIAVTLIFAVVALSGEVAGLRDDALAAVGYVTNWYLVFSDQSYFEMMGRPSLFRHLWSLAVEEQFYILWPLVLSALLWLWRPRYVLPLVLGGAVASAMLMALLYRPDADPSRVYYGTDTRGVGLLVGAALAFVWAPGRVAALTGAARRWLLDAIGLGALGVLVYSFIRLDGYDPFLYQGGFAMVALASAAVVAVLVHPGTHLGSLFGRQPLRWLGLRSYGVYLWHWPVYMLTRPQLDIPIDGLPLLVLRLGVTVLIAELSYRFVETPARRGALGRIWRALRGASAALRWRLGIQWAGAGGAALAAVAFVGMSVVGAQRPTPPSYLSVDAVHIVLPASAAGEAAQRYPATIAPTAAGAPGPNIATSRRATAARTSPTATPGAPMPTAAPTAEPVADPLPAATAPPAADPPAEPPADTASPVEPTPEQPPPMDTPATELASESTPAVTDPPPDEAPPQDPGQEPTMTPPEPTPASSPEPSPFSTPAPTEVPIVGVTAIGDSVMLSAANTLAATVGGIEVDAAIGRQVSAAIDLLRAYRDAGRLGEVVVVHMGNNGTFTEGQFDQMMEVLAGVRRVVFVSLTVPRDWEGSNNTVLADGVARYPNAALVDWHAASVDRPDFFWDGIHLRPEGAQYYAQLIAAAVAAP